MQIDDAFRSRLAPNAARVIETHPDGHPSPAICNVGEVQAKHFTWSQTAVEHQANDCQIAARSQLRDQRVDLLIRHRAGQTMDLPQPHWAP